MSYFRSLLRRLVHRTAPEPRPTAPLIEELESRQMLTGTPVLTGIHLSGSLRAVTAVEFTFSESIDPTLAQNIQSYQVGRLIPAGSSDSGGFNWGQLLGFLAQPKLPVVKNNRIQFTSATYDDTTHTVTLTPVRAWNALAYFRFIRVLGAGPNALKDVTGLPLNGGTNTYVHWFPYIGKTFTYRDADGDLVSVDLHGPGQLVSFLQTNTDHAPMFFVLNGTSRTTLNGRVLQSLAGDGVAIVPEIGGVGPIQATILSNPQFDVLSTEQ